MEKHIAKISEEDNDVDMGDIFARYTTDVIGKYKKTIIQVILFITLLFGHLLICL